MRRPNDTKPNRDNRGMTLIEVIVSLLILMIIVVPLLSSFVTASRTNMAAKNLVYANTAGENVMEAVKVLGLEETAREFNDCGLKEFTVVPAGTAGSHYEVASGGSLSIKTSEEGSKSFVPLKGTGSYQYRIDSVTEGTDTYDIEVTISAADTYGGANGPNTYQYADLTAFSTDSVAVINPVIQGSTYDNKALSYFQNMNKRIMTDRYTDKCKEIDDNNRRVWEAYEEELDRNPNAHAPAMATYPPSTDYMALTAAQVSECISKKVVVKIDEITDADGTTQYVLNSEIVYSCRNLGDEKGNPLFSNDTSLYPVNDDSHPIEREPYNGYCRDQRYASLDKVMLVYRPFNDKDNLHKEKIEIVKNTSISKEIDLYIALQGDESIDYGSVTNSPNLEITGTNIDIYSQADFNISGNRPDESHIHKSLIADLQAGNKLYNVSVKVYESGSSYSKLVAQVDSTMLDD